MSSPGPCFDNDEIPSKPRWGDLLPLPPEPRAPSSRKLSGKQPLQARDFRSPAPARALPLGTSSFQTHLNDRPDVAAAPVLAAAADGAMAREESARQHLLEPPVAFPAPRDFNGSRPRSRSASAGLRLRLFHSPPSADGRVDAEREHGVTPQQTQFAWDMCQSREADAVGSAQGLPCLLDAAERLARMESASGATEPSFQFQMTKQKQHALSIPEDAAVPPPRFVTSPAASTHKMSTSAGGRLPAPLQNISRFLSSCGVSRVDNFHLEPRVECASVAQGACTSEGPPDELFQVCGNFPSEVYCAACLAILREKFEGLCVQPIPPRCTDPARKGDEACSMLGELLDSVEVLGDKRARGAPRGHGRGTQPASDADLPALKRQRHTTSKRQDGESSETTASDADPSPKRQVHTISKGALPGIRAF